MKTVLLLDHGVDGHKYAFAKLFAKYLLRLNFRVILVLPEKTEHIKQELADTEAEAAQFLLPVNYALKMRSFAIHPKIDEACSALFLWYQSRKAVKYAERLYQLDVDYVFFNWLDNHLANYLPYQLVDLVFPYQWAGLYFHPWFLFQTESTKVSITSKDNGLRARNCLGCGVHDEQLRIKLEKRIAKKIVYFPEIADGSLPQVDYELASEMKIRSAGKPIVGLIGLAKRKGFLHLIDVIREDVHQEFFYFIAGKVPFDNYAETEQQKIRGFMKELPANVYYYYDVIPEGSAINAVICACDILYLVYDNFKSSSNFLTKAAIFKKLSVGMDKFWIGENIADYKLGKTVSGKSPGETISAFRSVLERTVEPMWDEYLGKNREERLYEAFSDLLKQKL